MNAATHQGFDALLRFRGVSPSFQKLPASPGIGAILPQFCLKTLFHADFPILLNPFIDQKNYLGFCYRGFFLDRIIHVQEIISDENILEMVAGCTVILDGTDNLNARKVLNRASILKDIPFIYGGIDGFSGMVTTFIPGRTPCLECLFSRDNGQNEPIGIVGPVSGVIASIQSLEAIKLILGIGGLLTNNLLVFNGMDMSFRKIEMEKNTDCPVCGSNANIDLFSQPSKEILK